MESDSHELERTLLRMDRQAAREILDRAGGGASIPAVERLVSGALERIGARWERGDVALSQVYMSGRICEDLVDLFLPPGDPRRESQPRIALCVLADQHALGKRIVSSMLRASGFELLDYGQGLEVGELVDRTLADGVELLMISTLMYPSALKVRDVADRLAAAGSRVKIAVGGAPFRLDARLWKDVGADATGRTGADAVRIVEEMAGRAGR